MVIPDPLVDFLNAQPPVRSTLDQKKACLVLADHFTNRLQQPLGIFEADVLAPARQLGAERGRDCRGLFGALNVFGFTWAKNGILEMMDQATEADMAFKLSCDVTELSQFNHA